MALHQKPIFPNVYLKNLGEDMTEEWRLDLKICFHSLVRFQVLPTWTLKGTQKDSAFVNFETTEAAMKAVKSLNGS